MNINQVLLVDDDPISNFVSKSAITKIRFANEIVVKTNARDALTYLQQECQSLNSFPDLILLDLKMPGMDGFEFLEAFESVCRKIRQEIVVVILTSSRDGQDIVRLRKLGNHFLMNKPLTIQMLSEIYHRFFSRNEILK